MEEKERKIAEKTKIGRETIRKVYMEWSCQKSTSPLTKLSKIYVPIDIPIDIKNEKRYCKWKDNSIKFDRKLWDK